LKTKNVSQQVKVDATPPPLVSLLPVGISPDMTPSGDHVATTDTKYVELVAAKDTKLNPKKWVKKHESQIGKSDKLKLKAVVLHDGIGKEVHMTQPVGFVVANSISFT